MIDGVIDRVGVGVNVGSGVVTRDSISGNTGGVKLLLYLATPFVILIPSR